MHRSALYKMKNERGLQALKDRRADPHLYVSVRSGLSASPAVDMSALRTTADALNLTLEELDGACG